MGAIAEAMVDYARPLLNQTDGSVEQMDKALALSSFCYDIALLPPDEQDRMISELQSSLKIDDEEFAELRTQVIQPMIRRHRDMFPLLHREGSAFASGVNFSQSGLLPRIQPAAAAAAARDQSPVTDRYAPCPCNSGKKYKFCCGAPRH